MAHQLGEHSALTKDPSLVPTTLIRWFIYTICIQLQEIWFSLLASDNIYTLMFIHRDGHKTNLKINKYKENKTPNLAFPTIAKQTFERHITAKLFLIGIPLFLGAEAYEHCHLDIRNS